MGRDRRRRARGSQRESERGRSAAAGWRATIDSFGGFLTIGSVGAAILVVALLIVLNRPGSGGANDAPYEPVVRSGNVVGRVEGDPNAPVRIIEYSDFQCPFCGRYTRETAPTLREEYVDTGIATIEYRHMVVVGPESQRAAEAAECAMQLGFFWEYHDILFQKQPLDGRENIGAYSAGNLKRYGREMAEAWAELAPERSFDTGAFDECVDSRRTSVEVEVQSQQARELGVRSTPSFLINGRPLVGAQPIEEFRRLIAAVLDGG